MPLTYALQALGELEKNVQSCYKGHVLGADDFRRVLGHFASGVTVVTTWDAAGQPAGLTASSFTSVSLDPPLILICVALSAQSYEALSSHGRFAVNVLQREHEQVAQRFASRKAAAEKFDGTAYRKGVLGLPVLENALAEIECTTVHAYPAGDHTIFVGRVDAAESRGDSGFEPLLYYRGRYHRLLPPDPPR